MAFVTLNTGDEISLGAGTHTIDGTGKVTFTSTSAQATYAGANGAADTVAVVGASTDYNASKDGSNLVLTHKTTGKTITIASGPTADTVTFSNGSLTLQYVTGTGIKLGTQVVSNTTPAAISDTPTGAGTSTGGGTTAGQTFSLTTATTDSPALTTGNDTITGGTNALNTGDLIVDQQTTDNDVLNAVITADNNSAAPTICKIENVALDFKGFGLKFDAVNTQNSLITVSTTQAGNSAAQVDNLGANGVNVAVGTGVSTLTVGGTVGTTDATTVTLKGGNLTLASGTKIETLTLNSAGAANVVTDNIAVANAGKVQISGTQNLTLKVDPDNITGIEVVKATGYTGVATLEIAGDGASAGINLAKAAVDSILISVDPGSQDVTVAKGATVHLAKADTYNDTAKGLALDASGTLNLVVDAAAATVANANIFVGSNAATVNLTNSAATTITALDIKAATTTLNALGSTALTLTDVKAQNGAILNFSGHTGAIELTGVSNSTTGVQVIGNDAGGKLTAGAGADTIVGGAGADTIKTGNVGAAAADQLTGGAGADSFVFASADSDNTTTVTITDFVKGTDKLVLTGNSGTNAVDLTALAAPTAGAYIVGTNTKFDVILQNAGSALTATNMADSIQLGATGAAFVSTKSIKAGNFADNLDVSTATAAVTITGGLGADTIKLQGTTYGDKVVVAAGDSTATAYDSITNFDCGGGTGTNDILQLATTTVATTLTSTDFNGSTVTVSNGVLGGVTLNLNNFTAFTTYLGTNVADGDTVAFEFAGNTYVFQGNATADIMVEVTGVIGITNLVGTHANTSHYLNLA